MQKEEFPNPLNPHARFAAVSGQLEPQNATCSKSVLFFGILLGLLYYPPQALRFLSALFFSCKGKRRFLSSKKV
jgi:hypothetical protein